MENQTPTATPTAPTGTGVTPKAPVAQPGMKSKAEKLALLKGITGAKKADATPKIPAGGTTDVAASATGAVENQTGDQTQQTNATPKDPIEAELDKLLPSNDDLVDADFSKIMVEVNGAKAPLDKVLADAPFTLTYKGEEKTVTGIDNLIKLAQMGFASTERNTQAKQVIQDADKILKSFEAEKPSLIKKGTVEAINARFTELHQGILNGVFPNGQRIPTVQAQSAAVADLNTLKGWVLGGNLNTTTPNPSASTGQSMSAEEMRKQIQEEMDQRFEEQTQKQKLAEQGNRAAQATQKLFGDVIEPFAQKFLKADGKTVNQRLFDNFQKDTQLTAAKMAESLAINYPKGFSPEIQRAIIKRAAAEVYKDYGLSAPSPANDKKDPGAPPLKTGSGSVAPKSPSKADANKKNSKWGTPDWFKAKRQKVS